MYLIPNVTLTNNFFAYGERKIVVPPGQYVLLHENHITHGIEVTPREEKLNLETV